MKKKGLLKTNIRQFSLSLTILIVVLTIDCLICPAQSPKNDSRPNVVFILTDDQGYGDLACLGNPVVKTPNLDQLYRESTHFTEYHVSPMCTPSRGELMSGQYAFRNGAVFVCRGKSMIRKGIPTIANVFEDNGYATAHFGKWHLGDNYPYRSIDRGFQEAVTHGAWGATSLVAYWSNDYFDDTYYHNGKFQKYEGYCTDVWFNEATKWIKKQQGAHKPFFVYLATNVPHVPLLVEKKYSQMYENKVKPRVANFFGMITEFDENLGRFREFLEDNGLDKNTILIFMTDNGTDNGEHVFNAGMRGKKKSYYDGGHRVPFFIRWPAAGIDKPRDIDATSHSTDLLPTLIDLCKLDTPTNMHLDGLSLAGLILGKEDHLPDRMIPIQYEELKKSASAVLWNKWRLVNYSELYDIEKDPGERSNVADKYPDVVKAMQKYYDGWYAQMLPLQKEINYMSIGTKHDTDVFLCSANWTGDYADSWWNMEEKKGLFGYWNLLVASTGKYEISLYRWPRESNTPLTDKMRTKKSYAFPISKAQLKLNGKVLTKAAKAGDTHITFTVRLKKGEHVRLEPVFQNAQNENLCGANFTYIRKK